MRIDGASIGAHHLPLLYHDVRQKKISLASDGELDPFALSDQLVALLAFVTG